MMPFIQLPYRGSQAFGQKNPLPRWLVAVVLAVILAMQIGLLLVVS